MIKKDYTRLVISDLHLGSAFSKEEKIYKLLMETDFDELILAGDIIDFIKVPTFTKHSAKLFDLVLNLNIKKIIYIIGNHDIGFQQFAGKTVHNIEFVETYNFTYGGKKYRIQHGDQYEKGIIHWRTTIKIISILQDFLERYFKFNLAAWWVSLFKKKHQLKRIWDIIKHSNDDVDVFIMGHTHHPEALIWVDENEDIKTYVNTGDWIEHSTYVLIANNQLRLRKFQK